MLSTLDDNVNRRRSYSFIQAAKTLERFDAEAIRAWGPPQPEDEEEWWSPWNQSLRIIKSFDDGNEPLDQYEKDRVKQLFCWPATALLETEFQLDWLIPGLLLDLPTISGGLAKTLKTSLWLDVLLTIAIGRTRLWQIFDVDHPGRRVGFICAESGEATIRELLRRILLAKESAGIDPSELENLGLLFRMPKYSDSLDRQILRSIIRDQGWTVCAVDPLYLAGLVNDGYETANVHMMGAALEDYCAMFTAEGCTPILIHHAPKRLVGRSRSEYYEPMDLADLAGAGFTEYMRQWVLINRREPYETDRPDRMWVTAGSSAGSSTLLALNVSQGPFDARTRSRTHWDVTVVDTARARQERGACRQQRQVEEQHAQIHLRRDQIVELLTEHREGFTITHLRDAAGVGPRHTAFRAALEELEANGLIGCVSVFSDRANREVDVWRLVRDPRLPHPTRSADEPPLS
jgi:hypothetical protein